ncbi:MAG: apolipoprotein N-acyltransferase [Labilithrix sp.]|nr:apolipoprotein N-acyltransferase [Labilithrix sp.]MCW5815556.1 apolipoprotein N-acyltransferase [Labilithrix sp.]
MVSRSIGDARARPRPRYDRRDLIAFASGLVFAASTPPIDFTPGILVGLGLFASSRPTARRGFLFGFAANLEALRFVPEVIARFTDLARPLGWLALVLLSAAQALPWLAGGALTKRLTERRGVPSALAFAIGVYVATLVPAIFPWTPAGGISGWPILLQTAEAVGERGVSFLLALGCALAVEALATRSRAAAALGAATFTLLLAYGAIRMRAIDAERAAARHVRVALLQPDFDAMMRTERDSGPPMMARLGALTRHAEEQGAELTIWPESAYPYTLKHGLTRMPRDHRAIHATRPVLTGAYLTKGNGVGTNSALLVTPDGAVARSYDKRHLLWFGETVPLASQLPVLRRVFARGTGLDAGTESVPLVTGPIVASVLNCYEDTLPLAGREAMAPRPNLLVNVTNDAWFAGTAESELHLRTAVPRAIETRRDMVRAVNRGPTTWLDANGRILRRAESEPGLGPSPPLLADPALLDRPLTLYTRAGEAPMLILLVATVLGLVLRRRAANLKRTSHGCP